MKKIISLLLILCLLLSAAGCAGVQTPSATAASKPEANAESEAAQTVYPVTLTDQAGRAVTLFREPQRIVSCYYISTSAVIALGLTDRMVGVEAKAEKRALYQCSAPRLTELPSVGTAKEFDLEGCAALEPELVILPLKLKAAAENLEQLGIPVLLVNPENQELLLAMLELIAQAANVQGNARALKTFLLEQEAYLNGITGERPDVYLAGNSALLSTAGEAMYQSNMIRLAGGRNVAEEITDTYWAEISYEQLLRWDPAYIVLASDATYTVEDVLSDPNLAACRAVQNGNVVKLPNQVESWDSPIPGGILGSLWLASVLHEDQNPWEHTNEVISEYYETFYGFTYAAE